MSRPDPMIGRTLHGTIEIKRLIGKGGMGNVYEALQTTLERRVAVKVMTPEHAANPVAADYFIREAKQASKLRHPNIIQIIDFGKEGNDILFIAMEFVPGQPLSSIMRDHSPLPAGRVAEIMAQTMDGLAEAHSQQLVHRDLKPDNLMIEQTRDGRDFVKILDFGIAQSKATTAEAGPLTQAGALVGTPQYMSPEQARGESVDQRSDLFSMGVILYEILTGTRPFTGGYVPQILMEVIQKDPPLPSKARPDLTIDPELELICVRALKKDRNQRFQSAIEFKNALERIGRDRPVEVKPAQPPAQFIFKRNKKGDATVAPVGAASVPPRREVQSADMLPPASQEDRFETVGLGAIPPANRAPGAESGDHLPDQFAGTEILHAGEGRSAEVIDTSKLFTLAEPSAPLDVAHDRQPEGLYGDAHGARSRFGLNVAELRADLVGEKRFATALVVQHRTRTRMSSEELSEHLTVYDALLVDVARRWDGVVLSRQGAYATVAFGLIKAATDDAFRATQASLDLRAQLRRMPREFAFGFGLAQGEVFMAGAALERATGQVLDDAIEAAREAGDDEVLVHGVDLQSQLGATFKLAAELRAGHRAVVGVLDVAKQGPSRAANLFGRDEELATGVSALGRLSRGQGALFAVLGQAGMGKTALLSEVEEFAEQRGHLVLRARNALSGIEGVRDAVLQWLRDLARIHGRTRDVEIMFRELGLASEPGRLLAAFMRNSLSEVLGSRGTARSMDSATSALTSVDVAFRALLKKIQETRAVVLTLDSIDDYDDTFALWYGRWSKATEASRVLWLLGIRQRTGHAHRDLPAGSSIVYMEPLDETSTRQWLKAELPQDVGNALRSELLAISAGIPVQIRQIIDYVVRRKITTREEAEKLLANAREVNTILQMRLHDFARNEKNLMALLSVLGNGTPGEVLFDLASDEWQPESSIQNLFVEGVIEITGEETDPILAFKPAVLEHVVLGQLSKAVQKQIHGRAADYYADRVRTVNDPGRQRAFELARVRHLLALDQHGEAVAVLDAIADECLVSFEYELADVYLARAVQILGSAGTGVDVARRSLKRVRVQAALGNVRLARDICRTIERVTDLPEDLSLEIKIEQAYIWLKEEDPDIIEPAAKRAVAGVRTLAKSDPTIFNVALLIRGLQLLAEIYERKGKVPIALDHLLEAVDLTERFKIDAKDNPWGPRLIWEPVNQLGRLRLRNGEPNGAASLFEIALKIASDVSDARGELVVRANLASMYAEQNRLDAASRSISQALKLAQSINDLQAQAKISHNLGLIQLRQKRRDLAEASFDQALSLSEQIDWREGIAMATTQLRGLRSDNRDEFMKPRS